jgi:hypothetical protein
MKRHVLYLLTGLLAAIAPQAMGGPIVVGAPTTSVPTYLSDGTYLFPPGVTVALTGSQFLLPIQITGAIELQSWVFDLLFESTVVQEVDPLDGSAGIYGAEFISGDSASLSFILGGFPFNFFGSVSGIGGAYPALLSGPSGDGILAYVLFEFVPGQENSNPNFRIDNAATIQQAPEPSTIFLFAAGLLLVAARSRRPGKSST